MNASTLALATDSPCNTTISDANGTALYSVATRRVNKSRELKILTDIRDGYGQLIATLQWHDIASDTLTLRDSAPKPLSSWLKKSVLPFNNSVKFKDDTGRGYKWDRNGPRAQFQLFADDSPAKEPIAWFRRETRAAAPDGEATPAGLIMTPRALQIRDAVVISFLCLEKDRRVSQDAKERRADVRVAGASAGYDVMSF